ncbi:TA system VapC family ribonuclease toxin [Patulibacter sp. S7RM1-6]
MLVPDVNLLLYAADETSGFHARARGWWEAALSGTDAVGIPTAVSLAFVRIVTNARAVVAPWSTDEALDVVDGWFARRVVLELHPGPRHRAILRGLLRESGTGGPLVSDAHLAALAVEHGATLCSADRDFARFAGLRWHDPLAA